MMNLAKLSANGQITVPIEIRRSLDLKAGDKILFFQNESGDYVLRNASLSAIRKARRPLMERPGCLGFPMRMTFRRW